MTDNIPNQVEEIVDEVKLLTPSLEWPPVLKKGEKIRFKGGFNRDIWMRKNIVIAFCTILAILCLTIVFQAPVSAEGLIFVAILTCIGIAITYFMYRNQKFIITDRAVYVNRGRPMLISSARKIVGVGATVRLTGRWGVGLTLLGVENASEIRKVLQGRSV